MKVTLHEVQYTFWSYLSQFLQNEKCFIQKLCAHFMFSNVLAKIVLFMRYVENIAERRRPQMIIWHYAGYLRLQTHTQV